ncbi:Flp family type IVb pilin [Agromyces sp. Marseille-P2726]|uniref:Flp family type IVb pilin n=1 Tax=Agromyces sp. Marseille-P2726 TaxID=2709132 RepID=UPI00156FEA9B|nr:Flp family type IVb pilin [Agromyces sp. Marseille-P2726]
MLKAYSRAVARINSLRTEEEGATATEYALVLGIVAIGLVIAAAALLPFLSGWVAEMQTWMNNQDVGVKPS